MKEAMIKLFEEAKLELFKELENSNLLQNEIDRLLDSIIEVNKMIKQLKED